MEELIKDSGEMERVLLIVDCKIKNMALHVLSMSLANFMVTSRLSSLLQSHGIGYQGDLQTTILIIVITNITLFSLMNSDSF